MQQLLPSKEILPPKENLKSGEKPPHLKFTYDEVLYKGRSRVYRGTYVGPSKEEEDKEKMVERTVVCKFVDGNSCPLKRESQIYTTNLAHLQGKDVPEFIGFFRAPAKDPRLAVACILFEDFGDPLEGWLGDYPMDLR